MLRRPCLLVLLLLLAPLSASAHCPDPAAEVRARAAVLMEGRTGQLLWAKNPHLRLPPASTTKVMAVLLALESSPLTRVVTVSRQASAVDGSSIWLEEGEQRTLRELVYAALLNSGNDACVAMAEAIAGSESGFARLMTRRARSLGARETTFVNVDGLPAPGHLTSACDLAAIARAALANSTFAAIARTQAMDIPWPGKDWERRLINHNKLLWQYDGADGVKTGYTRESGHCLVASATRGGRQLIAVILNSPRMYEEASALLDYGFGAYTLVAPERVSIKPVPVAGGREASVALRPEKALAWAIPAGQAQTVQLIVHRPPLVRAPVRKGQEIGWAALCHQGRPLVRVPLIAGDAVGTKSLLWTIASFLWRCFT